MNRKDICKKCKEANHCCNDGADCADFDLTLLNQQDDKIKELEKQIEKTIKDATSEIAYYTGISENQLAIDELEKVKFKFPDKTFAIVIGEEENSKTMFVSDYVDKRIKELKGE